MKIIVVLVFSVLASALVLSCKSESGPDGDWKFVAKIADENKKPVAVYMDLKSIEINDNIRKFWIRYVGKKPGNTGETFIRQTGYWEVDCFDRTLYRIGEEYYNPEGMLTGKSDERVKEEYKSGEALGAKLAAMACRYAGRK
ncbi:MAG TPA: hypothetical protein PKC29_11670 [Thermodesulfobacteriota bacterium]|nr:hypothetical protein [Thermodesulfobacteriota bacterium]